MTLLSTFFKILKFLIIKIVFGYSIFKYKIVDTVLDAEKEA